MSRQSPQKLRVLVVDDDVAILSLLEEVFSSDPALHVTAIADSQEAYRLLEHERYDILITDLMMPKVDGLRLVERAKVFMPQILAVILTGYASLETTLQAIHAGVYDYITKPFRIEEFRLLVKNAATRVRLMQENEELRRENAALSERLKVVEKTYHATLEEFNRLREELGRRQDLVTQVGAIATPSATGGSNAARGPASYAVGRAETLVERFDREIRRLERLLSQKNLSTEEFTITRRRLRLAALERGVDSADPRYEQDLARLQEQFAAGRLSAEDFERVRLQHNSLV